MYNVSVSTTYMMYNVTIYTNGYAYETREIIPVNIDYLIK